MDTLKNYDRNEKKKTTERISNFIASRSVQHFYSPHADWIHCSCSEHARFTCGGCRGGGSRFLVRGNPNDEKRLLCTRKRGRLRDMSIWRVTMPLPPPPLPTTTTTRTTTTTMRPMVYVNEKWNEYAR